MNGGGETDGVSRRFLQAKRRGPLGRAELLRLMSQDCVYVEPTDDGPLVARGRDAIADVMEARWEALDEASQIAIVTHVATGPNTIEGRWTRPSPTGAGVVRGRDVMTVHEGRIVRILVRDEGTAG